MDNLDILWKENNIFYNILCLLITENEKLFDRNDAILYWKTVFHIVTIVHHSYVGLTALNVNLDVDAEEIQTLKSFRPFFLTGWNFLFQATFVSLALLHDLLEWVGKHQTSFGARIQYWRDVVFSGLVVPFTMFVTCMFWSVFFVDRELVFPEVYDQVIPWWFNHCVHTNIFVLLMAETLLVARRRPRDYKVESIMYLTISVGYAVVYYAIYFLADRWLYKVFGTMTWWQVCIFQSVIWLSTSIFYHIQFPVNRLFHSEETVEETDFVKKLVGNGISMVGNGIEKNGVNGDLLAKNGDVAIKNGVNGVKDVNGDAISIISNGSIDSKANFTNGGSINGVSKDKSIFDKSWSLKYRSIRSQFESSSL